MATFEIGIRVDPEKGIAFFGVEEVNQRLATGARVIEVRPGAAVMRPEGEADGDDVRMALAGCQVQLVLEDG